MMTGQTIYAPFDPSIGDADILADPQTGLPMAEWIRDRTIFNKVAISFDWNVIGLASNAFGRRQLYEAQASVDRYLAQPTLRLEARGVRTTQNGVALMDEYALQILQRYGFGPHILRLRTTFRRHMGEPADRVRVSSAAMENPLTGQRGLDRDLFEIVDVIPHFLAGGHIEYVLLWTGAIESSAAPVGQLLTLVPGISSLNTTDVAVPFGSSVTVTTAASTRQFRTGLKHLTHRLWHCLLNTQVPQGGGKDIICGPGPQSFVNRSYTGSVTYRQEFKTVGAVDAPGTGGDPSTGWVPVPGTTWPQTRGSVAQYATADCQASDVHPGLPAEDFWSVFCDPNRAADQYNVKTFFDSAGQQADPCPGLNPDMCNNASCPGGSLAESGLHIDQKALTIDYVESIS